MKATIAVPAIAALVYRAHSKNSLTPSGLVVAFLTAVAHAVHPWNMPFVLLVVFFLAGTRVTHVKENYKSKLTLHSSGTPGGEGPRSHLQVLANSVMASFFCLLHAYQLKVRERELATASNFFEAKGLGTQCFSWGGDLLVVGIIANYACVAADTFSSELGILAKAEPRLITTLGVRKVPRGTNGGVTLLGLLAGLLGSIILVTAAMIFTPFCDNDSVGNMGGGLPWTSEQRRTLMLGLIAWGFLGTILDSVLGGLFQRSVKDVRSGKIVEGEGGVRVLITPAGTVGSAKVGVTTAAKAKVLHGEGKDALEKPDGTAASGQSTGQPSSYDAKDKHRRPSFGDEKPSRVVENGWDLLDNNDVNFLMAFIMSIGAIAVASWHWGVPLQSAFVPTLTPLAA